MSRKWVEREGKRWLQDGIISESQLAQIIQLYPERKLGVGILPILGGLLVGLGILSFIAANWTAIPQLIRLFIIVIVMGSFYVGGETFRSKGYRHLAEAFTGVGLLAFGGGIFLIAQMYHLTSNSVFSFVVWSLAGFALLLLYESRFLFIVTLIIAQIAQMYSVFEYASFSLSAFLLVTIGLGWYAWTKRWFVPSFLLVATIFAQVIMYIAYKDIHYLWFYAVLIFFYALSDFMPHFELRRSLRIFPLLIAFAHGLWLVFVSGTLFDGSPGEHIHPLWYLPIWILFFFASLYRKMQQKQVVSIVEWIVFLPIFYLPMGIDYTYLAVLFLFALYLLLNGYRTQRKWMIQTGTISFLIVTLIAYIKLTWSFMDKSLFFITAGMLLWLLSWFLYKKNKAILTGYEGGATDENKES